MDTLELSQRFGVGLAIGLLIGLERGWQARAEPDGERAAGLRTHTLAAVLGCVWGAIASMRGEGGAVALGLAFSAFAAGIILFRYREARHDGTIGATPVLAAKLSFALGAFAVVGDMQIAAATGVVVAGLLALKAVLHDWMRRLTWAELRSALVLLAMTCVVMPLLPHKAIDPWGAVNPFAIWLLTVMIAVISFAGYVAIKLAGERRGILISAVAGGLASSTAVTVNLAQLAREHPEHGRTLMAGVLVAGFTMMVRVLVVAGVVNAQLIERLAPALGMAGLVLIGAGTILLGRDRERSEGAQQIKLDNPLDLVTVLKFGALLMVVIVLAQVATATAGQAGAYLLAALSGIADVDAITLSMAQVGADAIGPTAAAAAIAIAVAVNTLSKAVMAWVVGGASFGKRLVGLSLLSVLAGAAGYALGGRIW